jgi:UDP-N-acetylmuramoylalanine--D-glutamate ligase
MVSFSNFKNLSFLVYGLGVTGQSVVRFFKKNKINNYKVWDDKNKNLYRNKRTINLNDTLKDVNYIVLSPGVSLSKSKKKLVKYKNKIITDIDLLYLLNKDFKSIVVTGTNGKSTTCKIINHLLKNNNFKTFLGGNIGTPILNLDLKKNIFLVIEASSYQLAHSKFICPDYAFLLNITNDHLDWHGSMKNYVNSKFKIFELQKKNQYSFINIKFKKKFKQKKFLSKLIIPKKEDYKKLKYKIKNIYIKSNINDENMSNVFKFSKLLNISDSSFIKSMNTFTGLPHRYEFFLKKKNINFINDSKATSFQATKFALENTKNIFWIVGGLPKKNDKIILKGLRNNIIKSYIIGRNINFFKNQIKKKIDFYVAKNLKNSIIKVLKDIKILKHEKNTVLFSPAAASFDQFLNFEMRGNEFKKLSRYYARKYI